MENKTNREAGDEEVVREERKGSAEENERRI